METGEFVAAIRRRAIFENEEAALRASRATLMTLGERLTGDAPRYLAAQLPPEIAAYLVSDEMGHGVSLSPEEFVRRIGEREGVDPETARTHARAVVEVLHEAVAHPVAETLP